MTRQTKRAKGKRVREARGVSRGKAKPLRLEWIQGGSLTANPCNWRRHPPGQIKALKATMDEVGWAGALLFNETTGHLIDGHARKKIADPKSYLPVLVGRWSEPHEKLILATLDPLAAMAQANSDALENLLASPDVDLSGAGMEELSALLDDLIEQGEDDGGTRSERAKAEAQSAARARKVSDLYSVIIECKNERDQLAFYRRMQKEGRKCKLYVL